MYTRCKCGRTVPLEMAEREGKVILVIKAHRPGHEHHGFGGASRAARKRATCPESGTEMVRYGQWE